jgi:hypothetical protein
MIIEGLLTEVKINFDKLIVKEKLRNQKLLLDNVLSYEQGVDRIKREFLETVVVYKNWYHLFLNDQINLGLI